MAEKKRSIAQKRRRLRTTQKIVFLINISISYDMPYDLMASNPFKKEIHQETYVYKQSCDIRDLNSEFDMISPGNGKL